MLIKIKKYYDDYSFRFFNIHVLKLQTELYRKWAWLHKYFFGTPRFIILDPPLKNMNGTPWEFLRSPANMFGLPGMSSAMSENLNKTWENSGLSTTVPGPKIPRSPGTTQDIPGCPTRIDYQSPLSKDPQNSWEYSSRNVLPGLIEVPLQRSQVVLRLLRTSRDVLSDMTTKFPGPKIQRSPGTTQDIPGYPTRIDYQNTTPKDPKKSGIFYQD